MKRFTMSLILACVLATTALAGDIPSTGTPAPGDIPSTGSPSPGGLPTDGSAGETPSGDLTVLLTFLDLVF